MRAEQSITDPKLDTVQRIELLEQVGEFLKRNIVQGIKKSPEESRYLLNIHKETELGDNDDLKKKKSTLSAGNTAGGGCCGNGQIELEQRWLLILDSILSSIQSIDHFVMYIHNSV